MPRSLSRTSNSRPFRQTPQSEHVLLSRGFSGKLHLKSLFCNILSISHLDLIFCGELFIVALCFQYFGNNNGRGYSRANSLTVPPNGHLLGAAPLPSLIRYIRNSLCGIGTLVYGVGFAKTQERVWPPDRVLERDGPFQYSGRERNFLAKSLSAGSRFGSPNRHGELPDLAGDTKCRGGPKPSTSGNTTVLKQFPYNIARCAVPRIGTRSARCGTWQAIFM